jgi:hypothetical protein
MTAIRILSNSKQNKLDSNALHCTVLQKLTFVVIFVTALIQCIFKWPGQVCQQMGLNDKKVTFTKKPENAFLFRKVGERYKNRKSFPSPAFASRVQLYDLFCLQLIQSFHLVLGYLFDMRLLTCARSSEMAAHHLVWQISLVLVLSQFQHGSLMS